MHEDGANRKNPNFSENVFGRGKYFSGIGGKDLSLEPAAGSRVLGMILPYAERSGGLLPYSVQSFGILCLTLTMAVPQPASSQVPSPEHQIAAAVQAAPADQRAEATILGYDAEGSLVTLRMGGNELVCLSDDPKDTRFSVACYHASLEPYMARGRALAAQGIADGMERNQLRWQEAEEGSLPLPENPATLYVLSGSGFDPASGAVSEPYLRYVVYVPWATLEDTGLPAQPMGPGSPWLMFPGTAGAHIMISPAPNKGG